ncbi:MAG: hypothetical protein MJE68_25310 [Proteobacteria bacterium]|nr:hypothetical protein [Pseudomonadota bacterium]
MEFAKEFRIRAGESQDIAYGGLVYDVIWMLALALNKTLSMVDAGNSSVIETGCENATGSLVPLENFSYSNEKMGCIMQWNLQRTNFSGVSVSIPFCRKCNT